MKDEERVRSSLDSLRDFGVEIDDRDLDEASVRGAARRVGGATRRLIDDLLRYPRDEVGGRGGQFRPKRSSFAVRPPSRAERVKRRETLVRSLRSAAAKERERASGAMNRGKPGEAMGHYDAARKLDEEATKAAVAETPREMIGMESPEAATFVPAGRLVSRGVVRPLREDQVGHVGDFVALTRSAQKDPEWDAGWDLDRPRGRVLAVGPEGITVDWSLSLPERVEQHRQDSLPDTLPPGVTIEPPERLALVNNFDRSEALPPGKYWVGDISVAFDDEWYDTYTSAEVKPERRTNIRQRQPERVLTSDTTEDGRFFVAAETVDGPGTYTAIDTTKGRPGTNKRFNLSLGLLGVMPAGKGRAPAGLRPVTFDEPFTIEIDEGFVRIGGKDQSISAETDLGMDSPGVWPPTVEYEWEVALDGETRRLPAVVRFADVEAKGTTTRIIGAYRAEPRLFPGPFSSQLEWVPVGAVTIDRDSGKVALVAVDKSMRGQGFGTELVRVAREYTGLPLDKADEIVSPGGRVLARRTGIDVGEDTDLGPQVATEEGAEDWWKRIASAMAHPARKVEWLDGLDEDEFIADVQRRARTKTGMDSPPAVAEEIEGEYDPDSPNFYRRQPYKYESKEKHEEYLRMEIMDWVVFGAKLWPNNPIHWEINNGDPGPGPFYRGQPPNLSIADSGPRSWSRDPAVAVYHAPRLILSRDSTGKVRSRPLMFDSEVAGEGEVMAIEILMTNEGPRPGFDLNSLRTGYEWESEVILDAANWPKGSHAAPIRIIIGESGEAVSDEEVYRRVDKALREEHGYNGPTLREPRQAAMEAAGMDSPAFVSTERIDGAFASPGDAELWSDPATRGRIVGDLLFYSGINWSDGSKGVVARNRDGEAVALLAYRAYSEPIPGTDVEDRRVLVSDVKVLPEYRRQGLATQLIEEVRRLNPMAVVETNARTPDGEALFDSMPEIGIAPEYIDSMEDGPVPFPDWVIREDLKNASLKKEWVEEDFKRAEAAAKAAAEGGMDSPYAVMTEDSERPVMYPLTRQEALSQAETWPSPAYAEYLTDEEVKRLRDEMVRRLRGEMDSPGIVMPGEATEAMGFPQADGLGAVVGAITSSVAGRPTLREVADSALSGALRRWPRLAEEARFYWYDDPVSTPFEDFNTPEPILIGGGIPLEEASVSQIVMALERPLGEGGTNPVTSHCLSVQVGFKQSKNIIMYQPAHTERTTISGETWTVFNRLAHRKARTADRDEPTTEDGEAAFSAIILHEVGHAVLNTIDPVRAYARETRLTRMYEEFGITPELVAGVSNYATVNADETFAEMYAMFFSEMADEMDPELRVKFAALLAAKAPDHELPEQDAAIVAAMGGMDSPEVAFPGAAEAGLPVSPLTPLAGSRQSRLDLLDEELVRLLDAWPELASRGGVFIADDEESEIVLTAATPEGAEIRIEDTPAGLERDRASTALAFMVLDPGGNHIVMSLDRDPWASYVNPNFPVPHQLVRRPTASDTTPDGERVYNSMEEIRDARVAANDQFWRLVLLHEIGHLAHSVIVPLQSLGVGAREEYIALVQALLQRWGITPEEIAEISPNAALSAVEAFAEMFTLLLGAPEQMDPFLREKFTALLRAELPGLDLSKLLPSGMLGQ